MTNAPSDFETIAALDLDPIKVKLMHGDSGEGWSWARTNAVEAEYRRFLYLMKKYPDELAAPTFDVDIFWHYHILDTAKYAMDCQAVFGFFLHHFPYLGLRGEQDMEAHRCAGERMRELYEESFGEAYPGHAGSAQPDEMDFASPRHDPASFAADATAFSVRAPHSVAAAHTAFSVRAPHSVAAAHTAFSVRAPHSVAAAHTAFSVRAPHSVAAAHTAFSVRAPASVADVQTAFSVRSPTSVGAAQTAYLATSPTAIAESQTVDLNAFFAKRPAFNQSALM